MYILQHICISPQHTNGNIDIEQIESSLDGKLVALEPPLEGVPPGMLRRMSKAVRMGIGAGLPLIQQNEVDGIIIGTANGGMEDCIKFLNQIIDYDEGMLTPANFVQSTPNAIAGQLSMITRNHHYNATHVHLGLAFENALLDAMMLLQENPGSRYLTGGVDEISTYNYNIDFLAGWYNKGICSQQLYEAGLPATIAGEGAAMFIVSNRAEKALAKISEIETLHCMQISQAKDRFQLFLQRQNFNPATTLFISGENGDTRLNPFYEACEALVGDVAVARYKHITGEYPTASSFAVWLACYALKQQSLPNHFYKNDTRASCIETILLYNQYHGKQHSFIAITRK